MRLELYIRGHFMVAVELTYPARDSYLPFDYNCKVREEYVKWMIESLKNKYQKAIENSEWEIIMVAESIVSEIEVEEAIEVKPDFSSYFKKVV